MTGPFKIFAKMNGNHFLITNIFKLHKNQTFGLLKIHNLSKVWHAPSKKKIKTQFEKKLFTINRLSKMLFFIFCLFHVSKFQMTVVKNLIEKPTFFYNVFRAFLWSSTASQIFLIYTYFWQWKDGRFNFHGNAFCFFIFS